MKRLMMLFVAGILLVPVAGWAADDYPYPTANCNAEDPTWGGFYYRNCTDFVAWRMNHDNGISFTNGMGGGHWGDAQHWDNNATALGYTTNTTPAVGAIAQWNGNEGCGDCPVGHVAWVQGVNPNGTVNVEEYNFYNPCAYGTRTGITAPRYIHVHDLSEPPYHDSWVSNSGPTWAAPGQVLSGLSVQFKNDGTDYWLDARNVSNAHDVELWNCDGNGNAASPWMIPVNWISTGGRIIGPSPSPTSAGATGTFTFSAQVPSMTSQDKQLWVRLFHQGNPMDAWPGVYIMIRIDADPPTDNGPPVANPATNTVNSFSFSWPAYSDPRSGVKEYHWNINGVGDNNNNTATSIPAGAYAPGTGTFTFSVWAKDNVGNTSGYNQTTFTFQPSTNPCAGAGSPCPGRYIPNSCLSPGTCCTASIPNLQTLPDQSTQQWMGVGQPVRDVFKSDVKYSLSFEYEAATATSLTIGLGSFKPGAKEPSVVIGRSDLPIASEWKTFWSAPFILTAGDLDRNGNLKLIPSTPDGFMIRNVRIVAYPQ